jgi:hypothetical protein
MTEGSYGVGTRENRRLRRESIQTKGEGNYIKEQDEEANENKICERKTD